MKIDDRTIEYSMYDIGMDYAYYRIQERINGLIEQLCIPINELANECYEN